MLICHCHAVNDSTIRQCVANGARSGTEVREACGAGGTCGGCRPIIDRMVEDDSEPMLRGHTRK